MLWWRILDEKIFCASDIHTIIIIIIEKYVNETYHSAYTNKYKRYCWKIYDELSALGSKGANQHTTAEWRPFLTPFDLTNSAGNKTIKTFIQITPVPRWTSAD